MSEFTLPEGWVQTTLGEYIFLKNGYAFKSSDYLEKGDSTVPVIRISDIDGKNATDETAIHVDVKNAAHGFEVQYGDLLIAMSGATTGKTGIYRGKAVAYQNQRVGNLKLHSEKYGSIEYKNHLVYSLSAEILKVAYGGAQPNISGKAIEEFSIALPPLAEQQQIAQKLDDLLAQVDTLKTRLDAIPNILKRFRQSVLAAAVSGRLTEEWRNENSFELSDWVEGVLGDFAKKPTYGSSSKSQPEGLVPVLRMGNLQGGKLDWSDLVYTSDSDEIRKYKLVRGDVLFNRTNSPELVGKTSMYKGEREAIYAGYLICVKCNENLLPEYLNYHLNSPSAREYCFRVKSDGVSQSNINAQKLMAYRISLPCLQEQTEIVRRVEQLFAYADQIEQRVKDAQARVNHLTQSILAKAFRGELTADWRAQNPELITGENSAAKLLERIKAEREATKPKKKAKGKI